VFGRVETCLGARLLHALMALCLIGAAAPSHAGGRVFTGQSVASAALGRSLPYTAYLPEAAADTSRHFPVLLLLHGKGDDETAWLDKGGIRATLDREIAAGAMKPLIVVMPGVGNSWYVDDARPEGFGPVTRAILDELVPEMDRRFPTLGCSQARATGGLSMGGYGAVLYAVSRPDLFSAAFSLSGSLFSDDAADIESRRAAYGRIYDGVFGLPFDAQRFLDWNVFTRLNRGSAALDGLSFWLHAGDDDFPSILLGTVRFHQALRRKGIASKLHVVEGGHSWEMWSRQVGPALGWLSGRLKERC